MALLPVTGTRTSTPLQTQRLLFQLNHDQLDLQRHYDQLSTGRRVLRISDDPAAASRAIGLQRSVEYNQQLARNATTTESFYTAADNTISQVDSALIEARAAALPAAQNVISEGERQALATTVRQSLQQVLRAGNADFRDHQLFSGILQTGSSFLSQGETVLFTGSDAVGLTNAGGGDPVATGVSVREAFGTTEPMFPTRPLEAGLTETTRLGDVRGGRGVRPNVIRVSDGNGWTEVDLSSATTMGDIRDLLNETELGGRELTFTILEDGARLEYSDGLGGTLAVADVPGGKMAADLSLENKNGMQPPPLVASGLAPRTTTSTKLADLSAGSGIDVSAGLQIQQGNDRHIVDLAGAETVGDVLIAINRSDADVRAQLNLETGSIDLIGLRSGVDYSIGENGGDAAGSLGIRSANRETRLAELDRGRGISESADQPPLTITRPDGIQFDLEFVALTTVGDVITAINEHPDNVGTGSVVASLAEQGNGLVLQAPPGTEPLTVSQPGGARAGYALGLIPRGQNEASGETVSGIATLQGVDFRPAEAAGAVDTLLRLEQAIRAGDEGEIERLQGTLDVDLDRAIRARGKLGVWSQNIDILRSDAETMTTALKGQLSNEVDADFAQVIAEMTQRQTSLDASLRLMGQASQMTVLNYL